MTQPMTRIGMLAILLSGLTPLGASAQSARLTRWQGPAVLVPNPGPGPVYFRLVAEVTWPPDAIREPARYAVHVTLPDNQVIYQSINVNEGPGSPVVSVYVPTNAVRNRRPGQVQLSAVLATAGGGILSNPLRATIADFPNPGVGGPPPDQGPFGWGQPLPASGAAPLPHPGPTGLKFVRIPAEDNRRAFFLATTEISNTQAADAWKEYAPPTGRSDEFALEDPDQPAFGFTPDRANAFLAALTSRDGTGPVYRLPTRDEWDWAAKAGRSTAFWWGDEPSHPEGANFIGPEPALQADTIAACQPSEVEPTFHVNPWGLFHTFGNVTEWATDAGGFARMGGTFRTEPAVPLDEPVLKAANGTGPDLFVGVRPAFELSEATAIDRLREAIIANPRLAGVSVRFDTARATATLTGQVGEPALRRLADETLKPFWWLAAVENQLVLPATTSGQLVRLGPATATPSTLARAGRQYRIVPIEVHWAGTLPVAGSEWRINLFGPTEPISSFELDTPEIGQGQWLRIPLDRSILAPGTVVTVALSLGAPATNPADANIVSNTVTVTVPE